MLSTLGELVQVVGLPIALFALYFGQRDARRSRDLQTALSLIESFRTRWEGTWRDAITTAERSAKNGDPADAATRTEFLNMLNWIDWLGSLIETRALGRPDPLILTLQPQLRRILELAEPVLRDDTRALSADNWIGVGRVRRILDRKAISTPPRTADAMRPAATDAHGV
jgi:hypothetical protein